MEHPFVDEQQMAQQYMDQQRAKQQYVDQQKKRQEKTKSIVRVAVLVLVVAGGLWWFSGSPAKAYGVWRVVGSAGLDGSRAGMGEISTDATGMGSFFEFDETSCTMYVVFGGRAWSRTGNSEWMSRRGKLYCKAPGAGGSKLVITVVDDDTLIIGNTGNGITLTRCSPSEAEAVKAAAGE